MLILSGCGDSEFFGKLNHLKDLQTNCQSRTTTSLGIPKANIETIDSISELLTTQTRSDEVDEPIPCIISTHCIESIIKDNHTVIPSPEILPDLIDYTESDNSVRDKMNIPVVVNRRGRPFR